MELPDEVRRDVERAIVRWGEKMASRKRDDLEFEWRMFSNWLFGAEVILGLLGLEELARAAADAQKETTK